MNLKSTLLTVATAILLSAGGMFTYFYFTKSNNSQTSKQAVDIPLERFAKSNQSSNSNLQVKSAQNTKNDNQNQSQLPDPSQFSGYEQYAQSESTQYIDVIEGTGKEAVPGTTVHMVYKGYLTDGTLFDQNRTNELNQIVAFPFTLGSGQVIQGWDQGIAGMKEGGKRRLIIPSDLGYGATGSPDGIIPPNSMLIFDVELIKVDETQ